MKESRYYIKKLTSAEAQVDNNNVHEIYIRLNNDFDYKSFFQNEGFINGTVRQIDFDVEDLTYLHPHKNYKLRFVYYENSNHEKRIPSLSDIFREHGVLAGDVVCLESRTIDGKTSFYITFNKMCEFPLSGDSLFYSVKENCVNQLELYKTLNNEQREAVFAYYIEHLEARKVGKDQISKYSHTYIPHVNKYVSRIKGLNTLFDVCSLTQCEQINKIVTKDTNPDPNYAGAYQSSFNKYVRMLIELMSSNCRFDMRDFGATNLTPTNQAKQVTLPLQQIVYGAPGTGKSFGMDEDVKLYNMQDIRTTFHPDSDYSTFVGAYKPQMEKVTVRDDRGFPVKENGQIVYEKKIVYKYTQQAFLKAYIAAWKDLENPHVLVIEEINRGNCAQIFGDLFQLLDRNDIGFSKYPINADTDIMQVLNEEFDGLTIANSEAINVHYKDDVVADVLNGSRLLLPNNLYIWATMNTSDQSLFPIDSAFKRRWEWKYVPISDAGKNWKISVNGAEYDWWSFIEKINQKIWDATHSEDKKLGYFFCKADRKVKESDEENMIISADRFVGKVLFYIYNDVFKDYGFDDAIFKDKEENRDLLFQCYFKANGKPEEKKIEVFLKNLEVKLASEIEKKDVGEPEETEEPEEPEGTSEGEASPAPSFRVTLDGETIEEAEQFDTYLAALKKMGMDKVEEIAAEMEYNRYDCPFVSKEQFDAIKEKDNFSYVETDGYQVIKGINKKGMSNFLKLCAEKLGHNITIE